MFWLVILGFQERIYLNSLSKKIVIRKSVFSNGKTIIHYALESLTFSIVVNDSEIWYYKILVLMEGQIKSTEVIVDALTIW